MPAEFGTLLTCMDGRAVEPLRRFLLDHYQVDHLDTIATAGIVRHLAGEQTDRTQQILDDVAVSIERHSSRQVAVSAHHDCAGNPRPADDQIRQVAAAVGLLEQQWPAAEVLGLWVDQTWQVGIL